MSIQRAPKGYVTIGVAGGDPKPHFARTLFEVGVFDREHGSGHLNPNRPSIWVIGSSFVTNARNTIVNEFLDMSEPQSEWLLMLDDDQVYPVTLLERLMNVASTDPDQRIIGLPVMRFVSHGNQVRVTHNVFDITQDGFFIERVEPLPENALVQVAAIGTGCLLAHRSALIELREHGAAHGLGRNHVWFQQRIHPADFAEGEDLFFCRLAGNAGIPVWCLTTDTIEHCKEIRLNRPLPLGMVTI